jgi:hypothetical protein
MNLSEKPQLHQEFKNTFLNEFNNIKSHEVERTTIWPLRQKPET